MAGPPPLRPRALVLYASTHGHTAKIAARIAEVIREPGIQADLRQARDAGAVKLNEYDLAIVGASVHMEHHQREMVAWVRHHAVRLSEMPSALFSVSLAAADDGDEARTATQRYVDDFEDDTGWTPTRTAMFAGALQYREYDFPTRLVMRLLMAHFQRSTDITVDVVYTDWDAVDRFAREIVGLVPTPGARAFGLVRCGGPSVA